MNQDRPINIKDTSEYPEGKIPEADIETTLKVLRTVKNWSGKLGLEGDETTFKHALWRLTQSCQSHNRRLSRATNDPEAEAGGRTPTQEGGVSTG